MSKARAKELIDFSNRLFTAKQPLLTLWQEIAENIYPQRADFTTKFVVGEDFTSHLIDSFPMQLRQELGDSFSALLRPKDRQWFRATTMDEDIDADPDNAKYLEFITKTIRSYLYDRRSQFVKASKQADHDYASFGNAVKSLEERRLPPPDRSHLIMRDYHLRDTAWLENEITEVDRLDIKDAMTGRTMRRKFGDKALHESVKRAYEQQPHQEFEIRTIVMPSDEYDYIEPTDKAGKSGSKKNKHPFTRCYIDVTNMKLLREEGLIGFPYIVSRWHQVSGSQYAFSPAAMSALPDSRMTQQLTWILLDAGEKAVEPPMIATEEAVRQVDLRSGKLSWIDYNYDERLGEALRPIKIEGDIAAGLSLRQDVREILTRAFYADRIKLPDPQKEMTAFETAKRIEEHIRNLLPLFEPIEVEDNVRLLEHAYLQLSNMGAFGPAERVPQVLRGAEITWSFESPIQEASSRLLVERGQETLQIVGMAQQNGFARTSPVDSQKIVNDMVRGINGPADWRLSQADQDAAAEQAAAKQQLTAAADQLGAGADIVSKVSDASMRADQAMLPPKQKQLALPAPARAA